MTPATRRAIWWLAALGFVLRFGARLWTGAADFWSNGYTLLFTLAQNIAAGHGLTLDGLNPTAFRVPLYPVFLAAVTLGREAFLPVVFAQSLIGAGTVVCAGLLAEQWFGPRAAVLAASLTAVYPYYVVHDTALQETSLFTLLTALSILLLVKARSSGSRAVAAWAGLALGAGVLTRASIAPFAVLAVLWLFGRRRTAAPACLCAAVLALTVAPWLARTYTLTGSPTLSDETGLSLWDGNNPYTFSHYPRESIDLSKAAALDALTPAQRDNATDQWFWLQGAAYIREHPALFVADGFRKIGAVFGWLPSPRRGFWPTGVYTLSYGPVMLLGLAGMWAARAHWREHSIAYAGFVSFAAVTAVFFGHTSHRAFLDVYWIVFAAGLLSRYLPASRAARSGP